MRSHAAAALCLSLLSGADARVPDARRAEAEDSQPFLGKWLRNILHKRQDNVCYPDTYTNLVTNSTDGADFCQQFMDYPTQTVYADRTPLTTLTTVISTTTMTAIRNELSTPVVTVTVTTVANAKRDADAMRALTGATRNQLFQRFRQRVVAAGNTSVDDPAISASFSSACSCANYGGPTSTVTYVHPTSTTTLAGIARVIVTTTVTRIADATTTTTTALAISSSSSMSAPLVPETTSSSESAPIPTAVGFSCPQDDNTEVSQMVGSSRYDYLINCGSSIQDTTMFAARYNTFTECAAACSSVDDIFKSPTCQGVTYLDVVDADGNNCYVKTNATNIASASGAHSARLQRIAFGISDSTTWSTDIVATATTSTESSSLSSMISSALANSTTSMPLITPGPSVSTIYSTELGGGTTFSTGTGFTTVWTSDGVWYSSFFTSWSVAYSTAATIWQSISGSGSGAISSTNTTTTTEQTGSNGETTVITNQTEINYYPNNSVATTEYLTTVTYNSARSSLGSSSTTIYIGGASGGNGGIASGVVATPTPEVSLVTSYFNSSSVYSTAGSASTSYFATQSVYTITIGGNGTGMGSGGSAGGAASGALPTVVPQTSATTIYDSSGTAFSTGTLISGSISSSASFAAPLPSVTVIVNGTTFTSGTLVSGIINGTEEATSTIASGTIPGFSDTSLPRGPGSESSDTSVVVSTETTAVSSSAYVDSTIVSGAIPTGGFPSGGFNFTVSIPAMTVPSTETSAPIIPPLPGSFTGYFPLTSAPLATAPTGTGMPPGTASIGFPPFGNSGLPRGPGSESTDVISGTTSGFTPSGTAPLVPIGTISSGFPPFNASGLPRGSGSLYSSTLVGTAPMPGPTDNGPSNITSVPYPMTSSLGCSTTETVFLATLTIFSTTTLLGCAETCTPQGGFVPAGSETFGAPQFAPTTTAT